MKRYISSFFLSVGLVACMPASAQDRDHHENAQAQRYYDKQAKDWHNWDDNESRTYQRYQQENHRPNRDFSRLKRGERDQYFRWRHEHGDEHHDDHRDEHRDRDDRR